MRFQLLTCLLTYSDAVKPVACLLRVSGCKERCFAGRRRVSVVEEEEDEPLSAEVPVDGSDKVRSGVLPVWSDV